jgi:recombination protein RecA
MRFVPTGLPSLERALGVGGLPEGRIIELYGREACGKSTLALQLVAQTQRAGGLAAYIDADHTFEVAYAQALGVDTNALMVFQPSCAECAFEIATVRRAFPL